MSFRTRLVIGGLIVAWVPVLCLGLMVRSVGTRRLAESNDRRMQERGHRLVEAWGEEMEALDRHLDGLVGLLTDDNEVRIAVRSGTSGVLQRAVARFASSSGAQVTYVLDTLGTIMAASHFPGDAGRRDPGLVELATVPGAAVVASVSLPGGDVTAVLKARRVGVGGVGVVVVAGGELAASAAVPAGEGVWMLAEPSQEAGGEPRLIAGSGTASGGREEVAGRRRIARVWWRGWGGGGEGTPVDLVIAWRDPLLAAMVRSWDRALLLSLLGSAILALLLGLAMARRLSDPLQKLAVTARRVHLGRLDATFEGGGGKELDRLGFFLNGMLDRIREGVVRIRAAEKRATVGELARQVNHDVRNGLVPIRNVMSHLGEAHESGPGELAEVFEARAGTLMESLDYLGDLADQYRAVAVHGMRVRSDLRAVARSVIESNAASSPGVRIVDELGQGGAWVEMDAVSLRRVVENVVANAMAAVAADGGTVTLSISARNDGVRTWFQLTVVDDGPGIPAETRARVFEPFFTTREEGTGLGLAIARRLVTDVGGRIVLDSEEDRGTRVDVVLKEAAEDS